MGDKENDVQDPAEPKRVDTAVETTAQPAEGQVRPPETTETQVHTTVSQGQDDSGNDDDNAA